MGTFANELAVAVSIGQKKRKRRETYEVDAVEGKLKREWIVFKKGMMEEALSGRRTCFEMPVDFSKNTEFFPSAKDLRAHLPEDLEDLRTAEGCYVRFEQGWNGPNTWKVIFSCTGLVHQRAKQEGLEGRDGGEAEE